MAIIDAHPGVSVEIVVNDAPLQEYDEEEGSTHDTVTKYVESVSGAEFAIHQTVTHPWHEHDILFNCYVDDYHIDGKFSEKALRSHPTCTIITAGVQGFSRGRAFFQNLRFAQLSVAEVEPSTQNNDGLARSLQGIGEIVVEAYSVCNIRPHLGRDVPQKGPRLKKLGVIPEKALKGKTLSHQASLGQKHLTGDTNSFSDFDFVDPQHNPFATYVFKYRSRDALESLLVLRRSPTPVPLEERDPDTLNVDELRELLRRTRAQTQVSQTSTRIKSEPVKRERSGSIDGDELLCLSSKRIRHPSTFDSEGIETIDLT